MHNNYIPTHLKSLDGKPGVLYRAETWSLKMKSINRLELWSCKMLLFRKILRILWVEKFSNLEVLRRADVSRDVLETVKIRKATYLGYILRGVKYAIPRLIITGRIEGKWGIRWKQHSWLRNLRRWSRIQDTKMVFGIQDAQMVFQLAETGKLHAQLESSDCQYAV